MSSNASNNCRRCTGPTTMNYVRYVGTKEITFVTARLIITYRLACIMSTTAGGRRIKLKMMTK